jgi:hypothetical protein
MFGSASRFFNIAPTISLPIFDGGRLRADLDARDADYDLAVAQYNKTLVKPWAMSATPFHNCATPAGRSRPSNTPRTLPSSPTTPGPAVRFRHRQLPGRAQHRAAIAPGPASAGDLNAEQIDLSIQLMQALGGGYGADNVAATTPATRTE